MIPAWTSRFDYRLPRITVVFTRRRERVALVVAATAVGVVSHDIARTPLGSSSSAILLAMFAAAPLGLSKSATACGLNSLGTFAIATRPTRVRLFDWLIYALTSTASGAALGAGLSWAGQWTRTSLLVPVALVLVYLGLRELGFVRPTPPIASRWQVPARWVRRPRRAAFVWGFWLGPGVATQMPHPMFYGLLALAVVLPWPTGPVVLGLYGAARSLPALIVAHRGASAERWFRANAYRIRLAGHAVCGTLAIALGVSTAIVMIV